MRRASLIERAVPWLRPDGADAVPEEALLPPGTDEDDRRRLSRRDMERSQQVAAAVALRELDYDVETRLTGVAITAVAADAPAQGVLEAGDVVLAVDGRAVRTPDALQRAVRAVEPGTTLTLRIRRDGETREVDVETIRQPDGPHTIIGVAVEQAADVELPIEVDIDLGAVGGPSAGLAFALQILEELGRDVDRGYRVAVTGELELDGDVRPVGGVAQKAIGARRSDVDVFVVPAGDNAAEARRFADGLRIIAVESFQQALRELATLPPKAR